MKLLLKAEDGDLAISLRNGEQANLTAILTDKDLDGVSLGGVVLSPPARRTKD